MIFLNKYLSLKHEFSSEMQVLVGVINSVSEMVTKSAKIHHPCKFCSDMKKGHLDARRILFFQEPHLQSRLQARPDEIDSQEFLRALSAPRLNALRQEINVAMIPRELP